MKSDQLVGSQLVALPACSDNQCFSFINDSLEDLTKGIEVHFQDPLVRSNNDRSYNEMYSCPLPPAENRLQVPIRAGEKVFSKDDLQA
jgi:hypothetical protein